MPSINRIRVNNVKYNFGTQFYDDFSMCMYGRNTLYDLANGGGKSVLMLLLLQNMIPNCTLDEKQPIEKLFRTGNGNTTIHSLIEWKLDEADRTEGYRYMTTGFCARKAKEVEGEVVKKDVAEIEYFNYCIFYREYNRNDIINLPLVKDGERVTYVGLRNYLRELEHRDMSLKVCVFDRKGEYQRFISGYGLHESQWELIRGINKTEGHVRTYFENNYKTTRKVVEDLLIEGIIEKAYAVKTERTGDDSDTMAELLMDIKEQLTVLAKKKKEIAGYDHQTELIDVLRDKVASFLQLYQEQAAQEKLIADICVTGEESVKHAEEELEQLDRARTEKRAAKENQRMRLSCLKVAGDKKKLAGLRAEETHFREQAEAEETRIRQLRADLDEKESMNEYLEYMRDRGKKEELEALIKAQMAASEFDEELLYTYAYNIRMRTEVRMTEMKGRIEKLQETLAQTRAKDQYNAKMLAEMQAKAAVCENSRDEADAQIRELSKQISGIRMDMNEIQFTDTKAQLTQVGQALEDLQVQLAQEEQNRAGLEKQTSEYKKQKMQLELDLSKQRELVAELEQKNQVYEEAADKLKKLRTIYQVSEDAEIGEAVQNRIRDAVIRIAELNWQQEDCARRAERLAEGRLIGVSDAAKKVLDYIETRHGTQAMYGMDYVSALPPHVQAEVLKANPQLVYGIVADDYETLYQDPNIRTVDIGDTPVYIYDRNTLSEVSMHFGDHVFAVAASEEYLLDAESVHAGVMREKENGTQIAENLAVQEEMLSAYRQDQEFLIRLSDGDILQATERLSEAKRKEEALAGRLAACTETLASAGRALAESGEKLAGYRTRMQACLEDQSRLQTADMIGGVIEGLEQRRRDAQAELQRVTEQRERLQEQGGDTHLNVAETEAKLRQLTEQLETMKRDWKEHYEDYYDVEHTYEVLTLSDEDLYARFALMADETRGEMRATEDKKLAVSTLLSSMERLKKSIENRGTDFGGLQDLESRNLLYESDENVLALCRENLAQAKNEREQLQRRLTETRSQADQMEGSIRYAIDNIRTACGAYEEIDAEESEILASIESGQVLLARLEEEAKACDEEYRKREKQQRTMSELYKDAARIVRTHEISTEHAVRMAEPEDKLRELFETQLMQFDRTCKQLDRAKNELLRFKGNTAQAFDEMGAYELAGTIRDDVQIPEDYAEAGALVENLSGMADYVRLERDRIEKSLTDMESLKANFEEQCLQRCLDVRTELDKLPKLSKITMEGEAIQVVGLQIPYVKDEFLRQRMSDYIDRIVAQADDYAQDRERMRFIRSSLSLKKLFGVIVTDMNAIRLSLYKRERIREQSRYLKYEEAVGSTGQSQGIYIQFLISVINYISGMYRTGAEDTGTKTIFIDNPFGAAKDVYIWEPIFALLAANRVQLIVPARGASPAITGRFDVNYILGQRMTGGKQQTVVVDYTSRVKQEELSYRDLEYEQVSFDFI